MHLNFYSKFPRDPHNTWVPRVEKRMARHVPRGGRSRKSAPVKKVKRLRVKHVKRVSTPGPAGWNQMTRAVVFVSERRTQGGLHARVRRLSTPGLVDIG